MNIKYYLFLLLTLQPDTIINSRAVMSLTQLHTPTSHQVGSSPPQYNHIQHTLSSSSSQEPYQHLSWVSSLGRCTEYSKLQHPDGGNHLAPSDYSAVDQSLVGRFSSAQSFIVPSSSVEEDTEGQQIPPVMPPRLAKTTSIWVIPRLCFVAKLFSCLSYVWNWFVFDNTIL